MTTTTTSLADWLLSKLAEDEAVALACHGHAWKAGPDGDGWAIELDLGQGPDENWGSCVTCNDSGGNELDEETVTHIARHDPARVLADVEAKREAVKLYAEAMAKWDAQDPDYQPDYNLSASLSAYEDVVRLLARPYRGQPGWRAEWEGLMAYPSSAVPFDPDAGEDIAAEWAARNPGDVSESRWHYPARDDPLFPEHGEARKRPCPTCSAPIGAMCQTKAGRTRGNHWQRSVEADDESLALPPIGDLDWTYGASGGGPSA